MFLTLRQRRNIYNFVKILQNIELGVIISLFLSTFVKNIDLVVSGLSSKTYTVKILPRKLRYSHLTHNKIPIIFSRKPMWDTNKGIVVLKRPIIINHKAIFYQHEHIFRYFSSFNKKAITQIHTQYISHQRNFILHQNHIIVVPSVSHIHITSIYVSFLSYVRLNLDSHLSNCTRESIIVLVSHKTHTYTRLNEYIHEHFLFLSYKCLGENLSWQKLLSRKKLLCMK